MIIHLQAVEQYFTVGLFMFQCFLGYNFGKLVDFGLGTVRGERVKLLLGESTPYKLHL